MLKSHEMIDHSISNYVTVPADFFVENREKIEIVNSSKTAIYFAIGTIATLTVCAILLISQNQKLTDKKKTT